MKIAPELEKWLSVFNQERKLPKEWENRKIGPEWICDFSVIGDKIVHIHMDFPKKLDLTQWKRFYEERWHFIEEHGPDANGWCEVWSSEGSLPSFTLDERPLFVKYLHKEWGRIYRWYGVKTSRLFRAQKEITENSPIPIYHPKSLTQALNKSLSTSQELENQKEDAKKKGYLFENESFYVRVTEHKDGSRVFFLFGKLHANGLKNYSEWLQPYLDKWGHLPHFWKDRLLSFSTTLTQNAYLNFFKDLTHLYPNIKPIASKWEKFQKVVDFNLDEQKLDMESTIELLQNDLEYLKKKNEQLEVNFQKENLKALEAMSAKSDFLNVINHELKTPLNGVSGMIELLKSTELSPDQDSFLTVAEQSTIRLLDLVNNLLDFAKIDSGKIEIENQPFEANQVFKVLVEEKDLGEQKLEEHDKIDYRFYGLSKPLYLTGDIQRLQQIAGEFLTNARKNTQKGSITLSLSILERKDKHINLKVEVADTGAGIPKDKMGMLFEEFTQMDMSTTRRVSGSGLGLSLCRKLLLMMEGKMGLSSEEKKGSKFWFSLPLKVQSFNAPKDRFTDTGLDLWKNRHVLIVESSPNPRRIIAKELQSLGLEIEVTGNGLAAIDLLRDQSFDLVVLGLFTPECTGFQIVEETKKNKSIENLPLFLGITNESNDDIHAKCLEAGMIDCLSKPINPKLIIEALKANTPSTPPPEII